MLDPTFRILFLVYHLFIEGLWTLTSRGKNIENFLRTWFHIRSLPIVTFEILGMLQIIFLTYLAFPISPTPNITLQAMGVGISFVGVLFASWAKITMGASWGRPAQHNKKTQSRLVTHGPFQISRNPIYVGLFLVFLGQQIALQSFGMVLALLFGAAIEQAVTIEEALLEEQFGEAYKKYKRSVRKYL